MDKEKCPDLKRIKELWSSLTWYQKKKILLKVRYYLFCNRINETWVKMNFAWVKMMI